MQNKAELLLTVLLAGLLSFLLVYFTVSAIDRHIENQDTMLCNSAKISGNTEYLKKCQCYYAGQPITCLQKEVNNK